MHKRIFIACTVACLLWPVLAPARPVSDAEFSSYREVSEAKLNAAKESRQKDQEKTEIQIQNLGSRIGDVGLYLTWFAGFLTVLLVGFGLIGFVSVKRRASEEAEKASKGWFKNEGKELEISLKAAKEEIEAAKETIKALLTTATQEINKKIKPMTDALEKEIALSNETPGNRLPAPSTNNDALAQADQLIRRKPEAEYTYEDWSTRAFNAYYQQDFDTAVLYWTRAANAEGVSDTQVARAMINKGVNLAELNRYLDAMCEYDSVISLFGKKLDLELRDHVAMAMINKGNSLVGLTRYVEAIAEYDAVISYVNETPEAELRERIARAMVSKGSCLAKLERHNEAIEEYNEVFKLFGKRSELGLRRLVAGAMLNKGNSFIYLKRPDEAMAALDAVIADFGEAPEPEIRELAEAAKNNKKAFRQQPPKP